MEDWQQTVLKIRTSNEEFYRLYRQGVEDMITLRLPIKGTDHMGFVPAAGVPWFVALFGRDSLIVSLQNALVYPEFARGALEVLGSPPGHRGRQLPRRRAGQDHARTALWANSHISSSFLTRLIMAPPTRRRSISSCFTPLGAAPAIPGCSSAI